MHYAWVPSQKFCFASDSYSVVMKSAPKLAEISRGLAQALSHSSSSSGRPFAMSQDPLDLPVGLDACGGKSPGSESVPENNGATVRVAKLTYLP